MLTRIKKADQVAAYYEAVRLAGFADAEAVRYFGRPGRINADTIADMIVPWPARRAETAYLKAFKAAAKSVLVEPACPPSLSVRWHASPTRCGNTAHATS
jgi:hypothetical protein